MGGGVEERWRRGKGGEGGKHVTGRWRGEEGERENGERDKKREEMKEEEER